jgi:hypothetical protein
MVSQIPPTVASQTPEWLAAWSTLALAILGLAVFWQVRQNRKTREVEILSELGRRWDSVEMVKARSEVDRLHKDGTLAEKVLELRSDGDEQYQILMREPGHLEDLGVIFYHGGIKGKTLFASMGLLIPERWDKWQDAIGQLAKRRHVQNFSYFREMAAELSPEGTFHWRHRHRARADATRRKLRWATGQRRSAGPGSCPTQMGESRER